MISIPKRIADELGVREAQVDAAVSLLDEGSTVPFIARYRKEATGGLDDAQLRQLEERLRYLREMEERREIILKSIEEQGKLTPDLAQQLQEADSKARLEDLYLPYRPKRRTKAQIAREAGLAPLAEALLADPSLDPETAAAAYVDAEKNVADTKAALEGARQILMEHFAEDAALVGSLRDYLWENARICSRVAEGKASDDSKFADYFDHAEPIRSAPSHRALAMFRGREEGVLQLSLSLPEDEGLDARSPGQGEQRIARHFGLFDGGRAADRWLLDTVRWCWRVKLSLHLEMELMGRLRDEAQAEAIKVFAANLRDLLLAAPAGYKATLGLDPGYRTGVKVVVVDATGKLMETATIYPHQPQNRWDESLATLAALALRFKVELVAIGNGTASRETDRLVADLMKRHPELGLTRIVVSESGASVYSASEFASKELPDVDVSLRGAASIARRLQDPLAELVKIDPKSIGVGQYQHDLGESKLDRALDAVVEDCVNAVGVDVNTASAPLLARVAGVSEAVARNIVAHRDAAGAFSDRKSLLKVTGIGPKTFEQAAGFLRVTNGTNPLDASAVHPEAYPVVERILAQTGADIKGIIGDARRLRDLDPETFTDDRFGLPTVKDILAELEKPGRDPRPEFRMAQFQEGIEKPSDLKEGMVLEGSVTNVTNFGAFVDIGVHQDGLVHVSALSHKFVEDPRSVVGPGDIVKVKVMGVDLARGRISLSMRLDDQPQPDREKGRNHAGSSRAAGSGRDREKERGRNDRDHRGAGPSADRKGGGGARRPAQGGGGGGGRQPAAAPPAEASGIMAEAFARAGLRGNK